MHWHPDPPMGSCPCTADFNVRGWSAYPPRLSVIADISGRQPSAISGYEQVQQGSPLLDDLVGASKQRRRYHEAEFLRCFQVDQQLEFCRLHDWQIRWFISLKHAACVHTDLSIHICKVSSIAHQATGQGVIAEKVHPWHSVTRCQGNNLLTSRKQKRIACDGERGDVQLCD